MIGQLRGVVAAIEEDSAILDIGGVGYVVFAAHRSLRNLEIGGVAQFSIETIVREDMIRLYGFETAAERAAFRLLQSVQGVGAKHALGVLQVLPAAMLYDVIAAGDAASLARAQGVGPKLAKRISTELQGKIGALAQYLARGDGLPDAAAKAVAGAGGDSASTSDPDKEKTAPAAAGPTGGQGDPYRMALEDAISALANLGYDRAEARIAVSRTSKDATTDDVSILIKNALKALSPAA
ncbi:MAG: Holliday junction branch migration protein RuvA [Pseudomonadota bacterium]